MLKLVIADDSDAVRARVRELISEVDGVEIVGEARDGGEALELVERLEPDVTILDIRMPGINGIQTLEAMVERETKADVIVLTSFPSRQHRERCIQAGATYFFDKATEFERVTEVLRHLTTGSRGGGLCLTRGATV